MHYLLTDTVGKNSSSFFFLCPILKPPLGHKAKKRNREFENQYGAVVNRLESLREIEGDRHEEIKHAQFRSIFCEHSEQIEASPPKIRNEWRYVEKLKEKMKIARSIEKSYIQQ